MTGVAGGVLSIRYTVIGTGGCDNVYKEVSVTVLSAPYPGILGGRSNICSIGSDTINARGIEILSDITAPTYVSSIWSSADTFVARINPIVDDSTIIVQGVSAGTSYVSYTVSASNGCSASDSILVIITDPADAGTISGITTFCSSGTTSLITTGTGGGIWSSDNIAVATVDPATGVVTGVMPGTTFIRYTVIGIGGCTNVDVDSIQVILSPIPTAGIISGDTTLCSGATSTLSSTVPNGAWSINNTSVATITDSTGIITPVSAGNAIVTYSVTGTNGCSSVIVSDSLSIAVTRAADAGTISGITTFCSSGITSLITTGTAGGIWSSNNTAIATVNPTTGVVTGIMPGTAYIKYRAIGVGACINIDDVDSIQVILSPTPIAGIISGDTTLCSNAISTLSSTVPNGTWSISNTAVATIANSTGIVTPVSAGNAIVTYTVTGTNGCSSVTASESVTIRVTRAADAGRISGDTTFCSRGTTTLITNGDPGGEWSSNNTAIATVNPITGVVFGVMSGTTYIKYTVLGIGGCTNTNDVDSIEVIVSPTPTAGTINGDTTLCSNATSTLSSDVSNGTWSISNTAVATIANSTGIVTPVSAGNAIVTYTVTGTNGCSSVTASESVTITVISTSVANAGPNQAIPRTSTALMAGSVSGTGYKGKWTTSGTGVFTPNDSTLNATYVPSAGDITTGIVTLTLTPYGGFCGTGISDNMLLTLINPDTITIVELTGVRVGNVNLLNWTSAKEFNNKGFELQRSLDGVNYYPIGFVNSIATGGTSNTPIVYPQYTDDRIVNSVYYYRLRQVKLDNTFRYSNVVELKDINAISLGIETVYPNPSSKIVNVVIVSPLADNVKILLSDATGKTLSILKVGVNSGSTIVSLDLSGYAAGIYYVRLICAADADCELSTLTTHKIIKL